MMLEEEVFKTSVFEAWSKKHVVLLRLDFPRTHPQPPALALANRKFGQKYQVAFFPTILFLNANGQVLGKYGYNGGGPSFWTKNAELIMKMGANQIGHGAG